MERNNFFKIILLLLVAIFFSGCGVNYVIRVNDGEKVSVDEMIAEVKGARVIIVGEVHDDPRHHQIQLDIIKELNSSGVPVAVGLEMFSYESQGSLDAWVEENIELDRFISIYKSNWKNIPWRLYKDIFSYAQKKRIPLVGLNVPRRIIKKVSQQGFDSLTEKELEKLPAGISCNVTEQYLEFIERVFSSHGKSHKSFINFCEAQMLWNKAMAVKIVNYLKENPQTSMVVLVGGGHALKKGGIPEQIRNELVNYEYKVIVPYLPILGTSLSASEDADFIILESVNPVLKTLVGH